MSPSKETVRHPILARLYARMSVEAERKGVGEHRQELLEGLSGRVIEVGAGNGLSFAHYPSTVTEVLALEPEPYLRERALATAGHAPVDVHVVAGVSGRLPAADSSFDAGVVSLVLCTVPDQSRALGELFRVIRPGGELRFYEHVISNQAGTARLMRLADLLWPRIAGGCHVSRDTGATIERAGFRLVSHRRFAFNPGGPPLPHILGRAVRP